MKIALALGGGGAKGIAHIGVLQVLEREGIEVAAIAGTSIGGLIGAVYAAGYSAQEMLERFTQIDQSRLFTSAGNAGPSLLGVAGISEVLSELLGDRTFDDLRIPLAVTAVDMHTGLDVELSRGRVLDAVLATIAVPGIFPPKPLGAYMLIDGGISNAIPVNLARSLAPDIPVLAVLLHMSREMQRHLPDPDFFGPLPIVQRIARMRVAQAFNIFMQSITISGQALSDLRLAQEKPDLIMRIDTADIGLLDRVDITSLAHRGEVVAEKALADLHRILSWPRRLAYRLGLGRIFQK